jgi:hypothetical protein
MRFIYEVNKVGMTTEEQESEDGDPTPLTGKEVGWMKSMAEADRTTSCQLRQNAGHPHSRARVDLARDTTDIEHTRRGRGRSTAQPCNRATGRR